MIIRKSINNTRTSNETTVKTTLTSWDWLIILYNKVQTANKHQGKGYDFITKNNRQDVINEIKEAMSATDIKVMLKATMILIKDFYTVRGCVYKVSNPDKAIIKEQQLKNFLINDILERRLQKFLVKKTKRPRASSLEILLPPLL